jgi:HAD superfamily hydrolase (TIGR01548 family)
MDQRGGQAILIQALISCARTDSPPSQLFSHGLTRPAAPAKLFPLRGTVSRTARSKSLRLQPQILIFDVDGVLVDVRQSFWRSALQTVQYLTGKRATWADLYKWKNKPGNNDDWNLVSNWATALGRPTTYQEARDAFQQFYWDYDGRPGNVRREKILVTSRQIETWARRFELDLFTGRTRKEFSYTFDRWPASSRFRTVVTMDDVKRKKPHPDGLLLILGRREPATALYVGDNIDDALAAHAARVPFIAILSGDAHGYRERARRFRELGALALLPRATALNSLL